ncbi:MAG: response regulator transcription factor [Phocaeicola plebeius]
MNIVNKLNKELLRQDFPEGEAWAMELEQYKEIAYHYAYIENVLSVLSDMHTNQSYLFYGGFAKSFGMIPSQKDHQINSIWEEDILQRIHTEDLSGKFIQELQFFHFLRKLPPNKRSDYYLASKLRMKDLSGNYLTVLHRMFYISEPSGNSIRFALCLYGPLTSHLPYKSVIVNSVTGEMQELNPQHKNILTNRELQILQLIHQGRSSKQIADTLSISIHTVSRHRQEILKKLQVRNSMEACRIAKDIGLL